MSFNNISAVEHAANQEYVHRVNVKNGWFDKPVTFLETMALIVTEIAEAHEAWEKHGLLGGWQARPELASEFADVYIRLVDDCSRFGADLGLIADIYKHSYEAYKAARFTAVSMNLVQRIRRAIEAYRTEGLDENGHVQADTKRQLAYFYFQLQDACDEFGVNLMQSFNIKMAVNEERGYRHGNKHA